MSQSNHNFSRTQAALTTTSAPKPNGNYSHVIRTSSTLQLCGWMGDDSSTGQIVSGGIEAQTVQMMKNIQACLEAAGSSLDKVTRRRIYMIDMSEFRIVDRIWGEWVKEPFPVSTCVGVTALAKEGARVEIEVDAVP